MFDVDVTKVSSTPKPQKTAHEKPWITQRKLSPKHTPFTARHANAIEKMKSPVRIIHGLAANNPLAQDHRRHTVPLYILLRYPPNSLVLRHLRVYPETLIRLRACCNHLSYKPREGCGSLGTLLAPGFRV